MGDETANVIIEHLRHIHARVDNIDEGLKEVKHRLTSLESMAARDRGDTAQPQADT